MNQNFSIDDLRRAVAAGAIDQPSAEKLVAYLATEAKSVVATGAAPAKTRFDLVHMLWYVGALLIMSAMGLFSTLAFSALGGPALIVVALVYGAIFAVAGEYLWTRRGLTTPGGLLIAVAVSMVTLFVFGVQETFSLWEGGKNPGSLRDFHRWIKGGWVPMELATIAAALLALKRYRFPFLVAIIAMCLWFLSMDLSAWLVGQHQPSWEMRRKVSFWFGLATIALAWAVDMRQKSSDLAFWLHIFGMLIFWAGVTFQSGGTPLTKLLYCLLNVGLMLLSVFLNRRVYAVFGAIGVLIYLGDLSSKLFRDSILFPFALSAFGVAVIALGLWYLKHRARLEAAVAARIPDGLKQLRPPHARAFSGEL